MTLERSLECTLTTPERRVFGGTVLTVVLPATDGELGVLPRHAPLVGRLGFGEVRVAHPDGGTSSFFVDGGFLQVVEDRVSILASAAWPASALEEEQERRALKELEGRRPGEGAGLEAREEHRRALAVQRSRLRIARRTG